MAQVEIQVAGRSYDLTCRDGGEDQLRALARLVDSKAIDVARSMGGLNESRHLLMTAILLADELSEIRSAGAAAPAAMPDDRAAFAIERLAERMEALADRLEPGGDNP